MFFGLDFYKQKEKKALGGVAVELLCFLCYLL